MREWSLINLCRSYNWMAMGNKAWMFNLDNIFWYKIGEKMNMVKIYLLFCCGIGTRGGITERGRGNPKFGFGARWSACCYRSPTLNNLCFERKKRICSSLVYYRRDRLINGQQLPPPLLGCTPSSFGVAVPEETDIPPFFLFHIPHSYVPLSCPALSLSLSL